MKPLDTSIYSNEFKDRLDSLKKYIARFTKGQDLFETAVPNMSLFCVSEPNMPACLIYEPCLCMAAQGAKRVILAGETYTYDSGRYLIASVDLPAMAQVANASKAKPYYGFKLRLDPREIAQVMLESGAGVGGAPDQPERGIAIGELTFPLLDAVCRLVSLLDSPSDIPILSPLVQKEIIYRLLSGPQGYRLRQLATAGSSTSRMAKAIGFLKGNFEEKVKIEELAGLAKMSVSAFHKHFKEMTAMSPLQYQKLLRLQEARRLMLSGDIDVATAAYQVGYESATQFNREYKRLFGESPRRDVYRQRLAV